jgi:hypothetical protein
MIKIIEEIEGFVSSKISIIKTAYSIFKLEAKLAGLSVFPLLMNLCMLFVALITVWISFMVLLGYFAALFFGTILFALGFILCLNLVLLCILLKYLTINLKNMSFEKTRAWFASNESTDNELFKKRLNHANSVSGTNTTVPTEASDRT